MRKRVLAASLAVTALTVTGCASSTLTAKELRRQAALVCTTAVRRSDRLAVPRSNAGGAGELHAANPITAAQAAAARSRWRFMRLMSARMGGARR